MKYRPDIDGLRAIAVTSVFIYHLNPAWLSGGFLGVDVFFVISGFLITTILHQEARQGTLSLPRFYQRRVARIFPAFFFVAVLTLLGASQVYTAQDFASAGAVMAAASVSLANVKFMLQGDYFALSNEAQPFLHYWSLSVEEQFYLLFPFVVLLARRRLGPVLVALFLASFAANVLLSHYRPTWAFYLLPTRAWELLAGCILAIYVAERRPAESPWLSSVGVALLAGSLVLVQRGPPGWAALVPIAGAVAILWPGRGWTTRILASAPMVYVGKRSYSLYLWHWPVFCFADYALFHLGATTLVPLKVIVTLALAWATERLVERPFRRMLSQVSWQRGALAGAVGLTVAAVLLGVLVRQENYINANPDDVARGGLRYEAAGPRIFLVGDSNGSMYGKLLKDMAEERGYNLSVLSVAAGDSLPGTPLWQDTLATVARSKPDVVILANMWAYKLKDDPSRAQVAVRELLPHAGRILLVNQPPVLTDTARALVRAGGAVTEEKPQWTDDVNLALRALESPKVHVIDIASKLRTDAGVRVFDAEGRQVFQDRTHLSNFGAELIRADLQRQIEAMQ